jgi:hypothetical protein
LRFNDSTIQRFNAAEPFVILIMSVLVVGSIAIDTVKTPVEEHSELLGARPRTLHLRRVSFRRFGSSALSAVIFRNRSSIFGDRARLMLKACNE